MTIVGVLCIVLGLMLSVVIALLSRSVLCIVLFLYHLSASLLYWLYSLSQPIDAMAYYSARHDPSIELEPGTVFVQWLTASIRTLLDASYLDMFMLFHIAGFLGVIVLYQVCRKALQSEGMSEPVGGYLLYLILFIPGLHVWTSAIGKDGLVFLGVMVFIWGIERFNIGLLALGLLLCSAIRPHVAALLAGSCGIALVSSGGVKLHWRVLLTVGLIGGAWLAMPYLELYLGLEELTSESVIDYVEERQGDTLVGGSGVEISDYSFPVQVFTFLYRPMFIDARSLLGLVVSFENVVYLIASVLYLPRAVSLLVRGENAFFLRFNLAYWVLGTAVLASTTSNVGLAIRQKVMVVPALIVLVLAGYARARMNTQSVELARAVSS